MVKNSGDTQARFLNEPGRFYWPRIARMEANSQKALRRRFRRSTQMFWVSPIFGEEILPPRTRRGAKGTRLETLNSMRGQKLKTCGILSKATTLSDLAPYHRPPFGFRTRLFRDNRIDYRTGDEAFDSTLG